MSLRSVPDGPRRRGRAGWRASGLLRAVATMLAVILTASVPAVRADAATTLVLLQMNLCNSGMARACYSSGKAVDEAVANIHRHRPALVTFQEVCRDDLYAAGGWGKLAQAMADLYGSRNIRVTFAPARNRITGEEYRGCANGQQYGVAMIHHGYAGEVRRGWYTTQGRGVEVRTWTCTTVIKGRLTGCTTHLSINQDTAMRQCRELMTILASPWMTPEVVVAGDFNLWAAPGQPNDVRNCLPPDYQRHSDDAVQQVFFSGTIQLVQGMFEPMKWTDHPMLYGRFRV
jgi:endonuclease/exonuclease/phosphatase family metal-dependent hydrolase